MKKLLFLLLIAISTITCLTAQVSFVNLTLNRFNSDTVYAGISNQILLQGDLRKAIKFNSQKGRVIKNGDTLICYPVGNGKMEIYYELAGNANTLAFHVGVLPAPELMINSYYRPGTDSSFLTKSHDIILKNACGLYSGYRVTSCQLAFGGERYIVEGNTIPKGLIQKAGLIEGPTTLIVEDATLINHATLRRVNMHGQYRLSVD